VHHPNVVMALNLLAMATNGPAMAIEVLIGQIPMEVQAVVMEAMVILLVLPALAAPQLPQHQVQAAQLPAPTLLLSMLRTMGPLLIRMLLTEAMQLMFSTTNSTWLLLRLPLLNSLLHQEPQALRRHHLRLKPHLHRPRAVLREPVVIMPYAIPAGRVCILELTNS
jgi:hypothetical protein